ncbi:SAM-dependent chlorinase/fluorinase [Flavobacteriales bacterium]|jgi:S-adenosyl-L-methionine hydrolase (adenosine-forming)|nr:SAM-dependent chlorinase/fluorinase [Flavobacteriales bacterium]MBT4881037.1 SAM-dependent chlorinase/fluorinase [Flavobacteriales bacterium]MDC3305401.1 SAM-dependent chlorinase/fluorinase [Flavobacteriales bacterium]MDC3394770.1 SAM-dependent chlorinase/fluorinase [Flavobacteriales bacterium]MDG1349305.1 SAM-dependent chlorinase/fluorinase [Flavobacteriales bacterium]|tara:strand:- start:17588 stop:18373 length:786 start_codon:yes stop_codon:yes gene_type:complete
MSIITLTSDLGTKDSYLASVKGSIYSQLETAKIVDITNDIAPFNIQQAAYVLRNCFKDFPHGTIHIISVDDELSIKNEHLAVKANGHYFIGADNGLFSLLLNEVKAEKIVRLNISQTTNCMTFATKNIFVPAACHLARGGTMEIIGTEVTDFEIKRTELKAVIEKDMIRGAVIYVDSYGNATTNISKEVFEAVQRGRSFSILFGREDEQITNISSKYKEVPQSEKLAIFGENNLLQIAINQGKANKLLGLKLHEIIRIEFR